MNSVTSLKRIALNGASRGRDGSPKENKNSVLRYSRRNGGRGRARHKHAVRGRVRTQKKTDGKKLRQASELLGKERVGSCAKVTPMGTGALQRVSQ